ncbi:MAG: phospholipase D-like domain-containing protein [Candidatus Bathyanammoxibius sp.]
MIARISRGLSPVARPVVPVLAFVMIMVLSFQYAGPSVYAVTPDENVVPLISREYFQVVRVAIQHAKKSIICVFYEARLSPNHPFGGESLLLRSLISATKRGVDVRMILEGAPERNNKFVYNFLKDAGVNVSYDSDVMTTHSSFIIIDEEWTIIGSHNWTVGAQRTDNDASVVVRSKEVAKVLRDTFDHILLKETQEGEK